MAAGLGPPMGGALVELGGWRWAFLINLPFGVLAIVATRRTVVESRAPGPPGHAGHPGRAAAGRRPGAAQPGHHQGQRLGLEQPPRPRLVRCSRPSSPRCSCGARCGTARRSSTRRSCASRSFRTASAATVLAGLGFYAYLLTNILWLQYVWGYDVLRAGLALVPGALVAAVVAARLGPLAERVGYRVLVVPGALVWAGAYLWYHQMVGLEPAFWAEWLPGQVLSGIGVGATLPLLGSAALAAVPGRSVRDGVGPGLQRPAARRRAGRLDPRPDRRQPHRPGRRRPPSGTAGCCRSSRSSSSRSSPCRSARWSARPEDEDVEHGSPLLLLPEAEYLAPEPVRTASSIGLGDIPLVAALSEDARVALAAASGRLDLDAGEWLVREGDPPGSAYLLRSGRLEVVQGDRLLRTLDPGSGRGRAVAAHRRAAVGGCPRPPGRDASSRCRARPSTRCSTGTRGPPGRC